MGRYLNGLIEASAGLADRLGPLKYATDHRGSYQQLHINQGDAAPGSPASALRRLAGVCRAIRLRIGDKLDQRDTVPQSMAGVIAAASVTAKELRDHGDEVIRAFAADLVEVATRLEHHEEAAEALASAAG